MNISPTSCGTLYMFEDDEGMCWLRDDNGHTTVEPLASCIRLLAQHRPVQPELRVLGYINNPYLVVELFETLVRPGYVRLSLAKAGNCSNRRLDAEKIFSFMHNLCAPASLGGWHTANEHDYAAYELAAQVNMGETTDDVNMDLLRSHPAYPAILFACPQLPMCSLRVLAGMLDPRWHKIRKQPDSLIRLFWHFGLYSNEGDTPSVASDCRRDAIVSMTEACVRQDNPVGEFFKVLWNDTYSPELTAHSLLGFISSVWLDRLTPKRQYLATSRKLGAANSAMTVYRQLQPCSTYSPTLFVPEYFFNDPGLSDTWRRLIVDLDKSSVSS